MVRSLYKTILLVLAMLAALLLVLGYVSFWVPIHLSSLLPFMGLIFPFVYLGNVVISPLLFFSWRAPVVDTVMVTWGLIDLQCPARRASRINHLAGT
jgi:hypothetical protein